MYNAQSNYDNRFYIDGIEISGLDKVDLSYNVPKNYQELIGFEDSAYLVSGPPTQNLSVSRYLILNEADSDLGYDLSYYLTDVKAAGRLSYNGVEYGFLSGYLNNYSLSCAIGSIPKCSYNFDIYDELVTGIPDLMMASSTNIDVPTQGSISVTCKGSTTNRVIGFNLSAEVKRRPYYAIGSIFPKQVTTVGNVVYGATVQIEIDDVTPDDALSLFRGDSIQDLSVSIAGRGGTNIINKSIPNAELIGESVSVNAEGLSVLTLNYQGHE